MLTVNDFGQSSLDSLTSSPTAPATLSGALIPLAAGQVARWRELRLRRRGQRRPGRADQPHHVGGGLAAGGRSALADHHGHLRLVGGRSRRLLQHPRPGARSSTPSSSWTTSSTSPGTASAASPLTSGMFSTQTTLAQYDAAVPASKVILGTPFFGIDWPTNNGTMAATATGGAADIADSQAAGQRARVLGSGHRHGVDELPGGRPVARVVLRGRERPVRRVAAGDAGRRPRRRHLGARHGERRGADDRGARRDLAGRSPRHRPPVDLVERGGAGRGAGAGAGRVRAAPSGGRGSTSAAAAPSAAAPTPAPAAQLPPAPAAQPASPSAAAGADDHHHGPVHHRGVQRRHGQPDADRLEPVLGVVPAGTLTDFQSNVAAYSCLNGAALNVYDNVNGKPVAEAVTPTDCIAQDFQLPDLSSCPDPAIRRAAGSVEQGMDSDRGHAAGRARRSEHEPLPARHPLAAGAPDRPRPVLDPRRRPAVPALHVRPGLRRATTSWPTPAGSPSSSATSSRTSGTSCRPTSRCGTRSSR